jgi:hypothetical protein
VSNFIENKLLYDTNPKSAFYERSPFSKFYLEIDNESPGKLVLAGWQIVRSYAENHPDLKRKIYLQWMRKNI